MAQYNALSSLQMKGEIFAQLFLDIDAKDVILNAKFQGPFTYGAEMAAELVGLRISHVFDSFKPKEQGEVVYFLLSECLRDYRGDGHASFEDVTKVKPDEIVCYCFGVTKKQLKTFQGRGYEEVLLKTFASSACGSCREDIMDLISTEISKTYTFDGRSQFEWMSYFKTLLAQSDFSQFKIFSLDREHLELVGPSLTKEQEESFRSYLMPYLPQNRQFSLIFRTDSSRIFS